MLPLLDRTPAKAWGLASGFVLLLVCFGLSVALGATKISPSDAWQSFIHYDELSDAHVIIQTTRLPRAVIGALIGANLAVAGALMQALTRNPLAAPSLFGINAGAVFCIVLALAFLRITSMAELVWMAFIGAALAAMAVYLLGSIGRDGLTPVKIVLAGAAVTALFASFTQGMLVLNESGLQEVLFWLAGSIAGRDAGTLIPVLPYMIAGQLTALALARPLTIWASGEDVAKGLGQRTVWVKILCAAAVVFLAGSSVAVAGSIGFVGLVIPHIARFLVGVEYRWIIPYSAVLGAALLLLADVAARFLVMPGEVPIGIMTSLLGVPFFLYIARKGFHGRGGAS